MKKWKLLSGLFTLMTSFFVGFSGLEFIEIWLDR